jgi:KaiC/GvpD/RAD55 family RecA-like ATPase
MHVPAPLRDLPLWLVWDFEQFEGEAKPRKIPMYAMGGRRHGQQGSPADRGKLTTFAIARDAAAKRNLAGVGFALMPDAGVVALDFDACVVDGIVDPVVLDLVKGTYAEYSPSGTGVRAFYWGAADVLGNQKSYAAPGQFGAEIFSSNGFVTCTGWMLDHVEFMGEGDLIAPLPKRVIEFCNARFGASRAPEIDDDFTAGHEPRLGLNQPIMERILSHISPDISRDEWIRVGMALHHECEGDDTGFDLWDTWSSDGATYPGSEGLRTQWDSFDRRAGRGHKQTTMASVIHMAKKDGYVHTRPETATSPENVMARVEAITAELRTDRGRFATMPVYELALLPPGEWLIKGVLPDAELVVLFGASGSGKTFVALDMAFAVAQGLPWRGNKTKKGKVVIIAAEGAGGLNKRVKAYAQHHGINLRDVEIHVITAAPNFLQEEDIAEVLAEIKALGDVALVVVDTLAQVTPGANENGAEDMGRALANLRLIREMAGATVMAIHHAGKDASKGSRGWSGIKAAADAQIEVIRHEDGQREIHLEKMKDGEDGLRFGFKLETVELGLDADGDMITSCVAVEADLPVAKTEDKPSRGVVRYGANERHVLEVIESEYASAESASEAVFVARCAELLPKPDAGKRDQRLFLMRRAVQSLVKRKDGPIAVEHGRVIFCT